MLRYCEKCMLLSEQEFCFACGSENLREPQNNDFCFLTEVDSRFGEMFENILKEENISCAVVACGNGVRSVFALPLENCKIYSPYEFFFKAKDQLDGLLQNFEDEQNQLLINNISKLFSVARNEKKFKKNLKLAPEENLISYCADKIIHADKIVDGGKISGSIKGGNYLFAYNNDEVFAINSLTYELISATKNKKK